MADGDDGIVTDEAWTRVFQSANAGTVVEGNLDLQLDLDAGHGQLDHVRDCFWTDQAAGHEDEGFDW